MKPDSLQDKKYHYDAFPNGEVLFSKKKGHLPPMGWNSWNAFGSGNTEALTKAMAEKMIELGLDQLGYQYLVLDDGCYKPERVEGELANEEVKFPSGFRALADFIHEKGLKFGMYNDIGTNLCAGAAVGTCGHEMIDARSYVDWDIDFIKVDNCYYPFDNATFSDATNARFVYTPRIRGIVVEGNGSRQELRGVEDGILRGKGVTKQQDYVDNIGTFDGTGPEQTPIGEESGELGFLITVSETGKYQFQVTYATGKEPGCGEWLQVAVGEGEQAKLYYDAFLPGTQDMDTFVESEQITIELAAGENLIRLMNHRRQENTLHSYAALLEGFQAVKPDHDIILSICEWGKTQPANWGYKVGDSWRILNDITFQVGSDGDPGKGSWVDGYTPSVTSQYDKAVIMDAFAGLDKGWNDPDMLMVGMNGLTDTMYRTHMAMWCMMNSPLMLGLDLRRVEKGDALYQIIANQRLIAMNQDPLGVQAKRVYCSLAKENPDTTYVRDHDRVDILAKPLADGSVAISFINVSDTEKKEGYQITVAELVAAIGPKMPEKEAFEQAIAYDIEDAWTGVKRQQTEKFFSQDRIEAYGNVTLKVTPVKA